jgi:hypothetical protein
MSTPVSLTTPDKERPEAKTLSIEIEPSPSMILDIVQLFRAHNQLNQAIELCKVGLNVFPQDVGLRLGMSMAYFDLKETDKAWAEIKTVAQELKNLAPILEIIGNHSRQFGETRMAEWFTLISQTLAKYPLEGQEVEEVSPVFEKLQPEELKTPFTSPASQEEPSFPVPAPNKEERGLKEDVPLNSNVLSTLNDWLSQLKGDKA